MVTQTLTDADFVELDEIHRTAQTSLGTADRDASRSSKDSLQLVTSNAEAGPPTTTLPYGRSIIVIIQLAGINFLTSFSGGLVTVALPTIAASLQLRSSLLVWPSAAFYLTSGTCMLIAGAFSDVVGPRIVNLVGCFLIAVFTLACGFSQTGLHLIMFRAMQGIASALTFPSSIAMISTSLESGQRRNIGFASLGLAMPLGFSFGLVLGGLFVSGIGWRAGFYIGGAASFLLFAIGLWSLPVTPHPPAPTSIQHRLAKDVDWVGAGVASTSLALLSYVLTTLSNDVRNIKQASNIALLVISIGLGPVFVAWVHRQEKHNRPALIPNSMWRKGAFATICVMVLLSTAVANCMELFCSLFFQEVQGLSALQASLRILPSMIVGMALNFLTGTFVNKVPVMYAVLASSVLCAGAPLLMALIDTKDPYWYNAFFAQVLAPLSVDLLFTVGILVVSDVFPQQTQALAGAVFNTVSQLGTSVGLATTSVISATVTRDSKVENKESPAALMEGYRATFFALFAWMVAACIVGGFGLRRLGKVGEKRD